MIENIIDLRVDQVRNVADGIVSIDFREPSGKSLPSWEPGAHIDLHLPSGLVRQYSLCSDHRDSDCWRIGILVDQDGRGGSVEAGRVLQPGVSVKVGSPRNHFPLEGAGSYVFVAGGIGITPLLPMAAEAERQGKTWTLIYGGRSRNSMAYVKEVEALSASGRGSVRLVPQDEVGLINLAAVASSVTSETLVYACGPASMLDALETAFSSAGKRSHLRLERFSAPLGTAESEPISSEAFTVELRKSGVTLDVPADRSLKSVLQEAGIAVPFSCEEGYCGSCETRVLEGVPEHHDCVLTPEEREQGELMMVCVGRCKGNCLVLDL